MRDIEIAVRRGSLELFASARSGRLARLWEERTGTALSAADLDAALGRLQLWFGVSG